MTEQKVFIIACAIKEHLIDLAVNDKLPMDMTQLDETFIIEILKKTWKK